VCDANQARHVNLARSREAGQRQSHRVAAQPERNFPPPWSVGELDSCKCNAFKTAEPTDAVIGCVYEIPSNQKPALDRAEGLGAGYHEEIVHVLSPKGGEVVVCTYIADASFIDDSLQPYSWYKNFVLAGAEEHRLPVEYVESRIGAVHAIRDPDPQREQARRAEIKA
jgi:hypothetical protein